MFPSLRAPRGLSLIDVIVGTALLLILFLALFGVLRASLALSTLAKTKAAATELAQTQMEYLRGLSYDALGTVGGIPNGNVPQTAAKIIDGTSYTLYTFIEYYDDPADGLGASDTNGITTDYKIAKVSVSYLFNNQAYTVALVSTFAPPGIETTTGGGTLEINVVNAAGSPVEDASVSIVNASTSPAVNLMAYSSASGVVYLGGAATSSQYQISVTKAGYSTAQTYARTTQNPNPNPGYLTVAQNQTTTSTFAIDYLATLTLSTYLAGSNSTPILNVPFTLTGAKTIGTTDSGAPIYKNVINASTGASGSDTLSLEWDAYQLAVSGYDVVDACTAPPYTLAPSQLANEAIYLGSSTPNSLFVAVADDTGASVAGATVVATSTGFSATATSTACGNAYFGNLSSGSYSVSIGGLGYATTSFSNIAVSGETYYPVAFP